MTVTRDEGILGGEPRMEGTRIAVRHVAARVIDNGQSPAYVADQLDLPLATVYEALSYYYSNVDEIRQLRRENETAFERSREQSLKPKEHAQ